jgi:hypothetical protein
MVLNVIEQFRHAILEFVERRFGNIEAHREPREQIVL